jgi:hypothetical protein
MGENMTIQQLRNSGYKVRVLHNRLYNGYYKWQVGSKPNQSVHGYAPIDPDTKGGSTQIVIDSPHGNHYEGLAICSKKENYNKKLGVRIALGRCNINQAFYVRAKETND